MLWVLSKRLGFDLDDLAEPNYKCNRCEDTGVVHVESDVSGFPCPYQCDCDDRFGGYGFPICREARLPADLGRWADTVTFRGDDPSSVLLGGPLPVVFGVGRAICRRFYDRGSRSMRYVDALSSPRKFGESWEAMATRPDAMFIGNVDKRLTKPQLQHLADLLQSRAKLINVVMGSSRAEWPNDDGLHFQIQTMQPKEILL